MPTIGANTGGSLTSIIQAGASVPINISTATTTQLVAAATGKAIYVTAWDVIAAGTGNITLEYGTGSNCGTGTTALTGAYSLAAQFGIAKGNGLGPVLDRAGRQRALRLDLHRRADERQRDLYPILIRNLQQLKRFLKALATFSLVESIGRNPVIAGSMLLIGAGGTAGIANLITPTITPSVSSIFGPTQNFGVTNNVLQPNNGAAGPFAQPSSNTGSWVIYGEALINPALGGSSQEFALSNNGEGLHLLSTAPQEGPAPRRRPASRWT